MEQFSDSWTRSPPYTPRCPECFVFVGEQHNPNCPNYKEYPDIVKTSQLTKQVGGDHYKSMAIQPIEYITKNKLGWCEGNIIKYISRWQQKGGAADIDKVIHYAQLLKELHNNGANPTNQ